MLFRENMPLNHARHVSEPEAIWPDLGRYCPSLEFPPYRHLPGITPHPINDPEGHSYGSSRISEPEIYLAPESWRENCIYLYGIDLYHHAYFWEAHEAWEELWTMAGHYEPEGLFLQGLIQNAAALLKVHLGVPGGVRSLSRHAWEKFYTVRKSDACDAAGRFMGVHMAGLIAQMERHYGRLWDSAGHGSFTLVGRPPKLELQPRPGMAG